MNWYRFKVELSAWIAKTVGCVLTVLGLMVTLFQPEETIRDYPMSMRWFAENQWVVPIAFTVAMALLWLCYWKVFRVYRGSRAYQSL